MRSSCIDGTHKPEIEPWQLDNVRPAVDATLGPRVKAVLAGRADVARSVGMGFGGWTARAGHRLLFLPGGAFLDAAIGVAMVAQSWEEAGS